jgi:hypothetical protein
MLVAFLTAQVPSQLKRDVKQMNAPMSEWTNQINVLNKVTYSKWDKFVKDSNVAAKSIAGFGHTIRTQHWSRAASYDTAALESATNDLREELQQVNNYNLNDIDFSSELTTWLKSISDDFTTLATTDQTLQNVL